jgi:hypothetical protein
MKIKDFSKFSLEELFVEKEDCLRERQRLLTNLSLFDVEHLEKIEDTIERIDEEICRKCQN